jgi:hypothetical protein
MSTCYYPRGAPLPNPGLFEFNANEPFTSGKRHSRQLFKEISIKLNLVFQCQFLTEGSSTSQSRFYELCNSGKMHSYVLSKKASIKLNLFSQKVLSERSSTSQSRLLWIMNMSHLVLGKLTHLKHGQPNLIFPNYISLVFSQPQTCQGSLAYVNLT